MNINAPGLSVTGSIIIIDTDKWITQANLAKKLHESGNAINNRIRRATAAGKITTYYIEELGIRLVPNVNNINELGKVQEKP